MGWDWLPLWDGEFSDFRDIEDACNALMSIFCVVCAGLAAGLTMGLMSLDAIKLELKTLNGSPVEKRAAASVLPIVKKHHLLLVTLLLFNSVSNESLPVFLGTLFPNYVAILISVTMVLIFGEIIPSALFTGPSQLIIAARFSPLVIFLMTFFWPIAFPISKILDYLFGEDEPSSTMSRDDFAALVMLQGLNSARLKSESNASSTNSPKSSDQNQELSHFSRRNSGYGAVSTDEGFDKSKELLYHHSVQPAKLSKDSKPSSEYIQTRLSASSSSNTMPHAVHIDSNQLLPDELSILTGVLKLSKQTVKHVMIPLNQVYMISDLTVLDSQGLLNILNTGFSRLLVYRGNNKQHIRGYLLVKSLAITDPNTKSLVSSQTLREPLFLRPDASILEALSIFRRNRCHIAIVCDDPSSALRLMRSEVSMEYEPQILGIVTMEDAIEEIIQGEIMDETDVLKPVWRVRAEVESGAGISSLHQTIQLRNSRVKSLTSNEVVPEIPYHEI